MTTQFDTYTEFTQYLDTSEYNQMSDHEKRAVWQAQPNHYAELWLKAYVQANGPIDLPVKKSTQH